MNHQWSPLKGSLTISRTRKWLRESEGCPPLIHGQPLSCFLADDCWFLVQSCWKLDRIQTLAMRESNDLNFKQSHICNKLWLSVRSVCYLARLRMWMAGWSDMIKSLWTRKFSQGKTGYCWPPWYEALLSVTPSTNYWIAWKLPDGLQMLNLGTRVRARRSLSGSESDSKSIHIEDSCWINNHHLIFIGRVRILQSFPLCSKTTFGSDPTHCSWCRYIGIFTLNDMFINKGYWDITWYWDITLYWDITWYWDITYNMIFTLILGYNMHVIYTSIYYTYKFLPSSRVQVDPQHFALDLQRTAKGTIQTPIV